jgi:hypothetical protein
VGFGATMIGSSEKSHVLDVSQGSADAGPAKTAVPATIIPASVAAPTRRRMFHFVVVVAASYSL